MVVVSLQQNGAAGNSAGAIGGAEGHGIWLGDAGGAGFIEPQAKLRDRVGFEGFLGERLVLVINPEAVDFGVGTHGTNSVRRRRYL